MKLRAPYRDAPLQAAGVRVVEKAAGTCQELNALAQV